MALTGNDKKKTEVTNDWGTDYQQIINDAVARGDYKTAAEAEQKRNAKIDATGSSYGKTYAYSGHLQQDYGTLGQQQMANNASWQDVLATYNNRQNKAMTTTGLEQYANDGLQQEMWQYIVNNMKESNQPAEWDTEAYEQENPKPTQPQSDPRIDALLNEILNRGDFSYDVASDPLYQQYAKMYQREGDRAMKETMAEAAAGAGGMNTYAITAAQQANSYYNSQLNDRIPELYQLAYEMYLNDKESKVQDLGILQNMDATQYNRYRDTINDWYNDKNFAYGVYKDDVQQGNWNTNFDYTNMVNNRDFMYGANWANKEWNYNDEWRNKEWDADQADKDLANSRYDTEKAESKLWEFIDRGVMPSDEIIAAAGWSRADVEKLVSAAQAQTASKGTSKPTTKKTGNDDDDDDDGKKVIGSDDPEGDESESAGIGDGIGTLGVLNLGLGPINDEYLLKLVELGRVTLDANGNVSWADGWNKDKHQQNLGGMTLPGFDWTL